MLPMGNPEQELGCRVGPLAQRDWPFTSLLWVTHWLWVGGNTKGMAPPIPQGQRGFSEREAPAFSNRHSPRKGSEKGTSSTH